MPVWRQWLGRLLVLACVVAGVVILVRSTRPLLEPADAVPQPPESPAPAAASGAPGNSGAAPSQGAVADGAATPGGAAQLAVAGSPGGPGAPAGGSGAGNPAPGPGLHALVSSQSKWELAAAAGSAASLARLDAGANQMRVLIETLATNDLWQVQLAQAGYSLHKGQRYALRLTARATAPRSVHVVASIARPPWTGLGLYQSLDLTDQWRDFELAFTASADEADARIHFDLGGNLTPVEVRGVGLYTEGPAAPRPADVASGPGPPPIPAAGTANAAPPPRGAPAASRAIGPWRLDPQDAPSGAWLIDATQSNLGLAATAKGPRKLVSGPFAVQKDATYAVVFQGQSPVACALSLSIIGSTTSNLGLTTELPLSGQSEGYYVEFIAAANDTQARVVIALPEGHQGVTLTGVGLENVLDPQGHPVQGAGYAVAQTPAVAAAPGGPIAASPPPPENLPPASAGAPPSSASAGAAASAGGSPSTAAAKIALGDAWEIRAADGWKAELKRPGGAGDPVRVEVRESSAGPGWKLQLVLQGARVEQGRKYRVHYRAKADRPRQVVCALGQDQAPWSGWGLYQKADVTDQWQDFEHEFVGTGSDDHAKLYFELGSSDIPLEISDLGLFSVE